MKIDFSAEILDLNGASIQDGDKTLLLSAVACTALLNNYQDEQSLTGETKVKRFRLAQAAASSKVIDLPVEDIAELKRLIAKAFGPLIVGRSFDLIEPLDQTATSSA